MANTNDTVPANARGRLMTRSEIFANTNLVVVIVGESQTRYVLHEDVVVTQCPFFKECLSSRIKEQRPKTIYLPEQDPASFDVVVPYMYTGKFAHGTQFDRLMKVFLLAEKWKMTRLQDAIVCAFREKFLQKRITPSFVALVELYTEENCQLREVVLDGLEHAVTKPFPDTESAAGYNRELERLITSGGYIVKKLFWRIVSKRQTISPVSDDATTIKTEDAA